MNTGRNDGLDHDRSNVQGDTKEIPDKGTSRGFTGKDTHTDGADTGPDANNRLGGFRGSSDDADQCYPAKAPKGRA